MTPSPDEPRRLDGDRAGRRPLLFGRPPLDDPEELERWISAFVAEANAALDRERRADGSAGNGSHA